MTINNTSINIISVSAENTNRFFDEATCCTGGGYWQFQGIVLMEIANDTLVSVEIDNTSCGDLGYRKYYEITTDDLEWYWYDSNMDDAADTPLEDIVEILDSIEGIIGIDPVDLIDVAVDAINTVAKYNWF